MQLAIRQFIIAADHGDLLSIARDLLDKQLMQTLIVWVVGRSIVEVDQQPVLLGILYIVEVTDPGRRCSRDGPAQAREMPGHPHDGLRLEQPCAVFDRTCESCRCFRKGCRQIKFADDAVQQQAWEPRIHSSDIRVLEDEHHLEYRGDGQVAPGPQYVHHFFKRCVLMLVCFQTGGSHLGQ